MNRKTNAGPKTPHAQLSATSTASRLLQRKCACGSEQCQGTRCLSDEQKKQRHPLQRKSSTSNAPLLAGDFTRTPTANRSPANTLSPPQTTPENQHAKPEILLLFGGLWDHTRPLGLSDGPVEKHLFPKLLEQHTGVTYWEWTDEDRAIDYVKRSVSRDTPIEIVGHSYGGDTGIEVANALKADGFLVTRVTTLDAVSWWKDKPDKGIRWINAYVSGIHGISDVVATVGGHYGEQESAENIQLDDGTEHAQARTLYQAVGEYLQFDEYVNRTLARKKASDQAMGEVPPIVYDVLRSPGQPLDIDTRSFFEPRFGQDFSSVRVHTDSQAAQSASAVNALAYTVGSDLVFASGQFDPRSKSGRQLLAHELTHVVQQSQSAASLQSKITHDSQGSSAEREAEAAEQAVLSDIPSPVAVPDNLATANSLSGYDSPSQNMTYISQRRHISSVLQRHSNNNPKTKLPSIVTMAQFIDLVRRVEASNKGMNALQIAQMIMRTKYHSRGFNYLLPSSAGGKPVSAGGTVTSNDITTLSKEFVVTLPQGAQADPSHVIVGIVAGAETKEAGSAQADNDFDEILETLVDVIPEGLSQRDIATWVGDIAQAAAAWQLACPLSGGSALKQDYLNKYAPESDLIADIDGVVMSSRSNKLGFAFNPNATLSSNLMRYYFPTKAREGKQGRFHIFCAIEGFALKPDNTTLSDKAKTSIDKRVRLNTEWFMKNKPDIVLECKLTPIFTNLMSTQETEFPIVNPGLQYSEKTFKAWATRANDWHWFADQFKNFVQQNLKSEGP